MLVPNPDKPKSEYRYGFQGQEKDDEIKGGEGNSLNYTFRMHDPRIGRFFATDPLKKDYPWNSPYVFAENDVIAYIELEGAEKADATNKAYTPTFGVLTKIGADATKVLADQQMKSALIEEGSKQVIKKQAVKSVGQKVLGAVAEFGTLVFMVLHDYSSPNFGRTNERPFDFKEFKVDEKFAVPDYDIKDKTIEELPIVRINQNGKDEDDNIPKIKLRHYTSNQGFQGIKENMTIEAYDQNTVFAERAKGKPLSAADAADKYRIAKGSARNYIEFEVEYSRVSEKTNAQGATEYMIKGDVKLNPKTTKFVKRK